MVSRDNELMNALYDLDFQHIKQELGKGANVNEPYNKYGWTPFM